MKRTILLLLTISLFCHVFAQDTTIFSQTITLNTSFSNFDDVQIRSIDSVLLIAGFEYSSDSGGVFTAIGGVYDVQVPSGFAPYATAAQDTTGTENSSLDYNRVVGSIKGQSGVSSSGAAIYNIPISVPKGTNNVEPQISLSYNSQNSGLGILGQGWSLNGISAITATGRNYFHDDIKAPISATDSLSRLVWDGQRLYGINAKGLEADSFKTEVKSYIKIEKKSGTSGDYFEVKTPNGLTMIYGKSDSSQMHLNDSTEWKWLLEKSFDKNGNYIFYTYTKNTLKHQILLSTIEYGGLSSSPINEIEFHYSAKALFNHAYYLDFLVLDDKQLDSISMKTNNTFLGSYAIHYENKENDLLINEIVQYDKDHYSYNPTRFNWKVPSDSISVSSSSFSIESGDDCEYFRGDYNGDGYSDIVSVKLDNTSNSYKYYMYFGSSSGLTYTDSLVRNLPRSYTYQYWEQMKNSIVSSCGVGSVTTTFDRRDISYVVSGDFDGDGIDELMVKIMDWGVLGSYLPGDLNNGFEYSGWYNSFEENLCDYKDYIIWPDSLFNSSDFSYGLGHFIHFDTLINNNPLIRVIRLGADNDRIAIDSKYPDILGLGYSTFIDDDKVKYYDFENDTALIICNGSGADFWVDLNGDGISDPIKQLDEDYFSWSIRDPISNTFEFGNIVEGFLLGTTDLNGDGNSTIAYLGPEEYEHTYYSDLWYDYTGSAFSCPLNLIVWIAFLSAYDLEDIFDDYVDTECGGTAQCSSCITNFMDEISSSEFLGREMYAGLNFGYKYYNDTIKINRAFTYDLNSDGTNELLLLNDNELLRVLHNFIPTYNGSISYTSYSECVPTSTAKQGLPIFTMLKMEAQMGDFNGDGIMEFYVPGSSMLYTFNLTDQPGIFMEGIVNGMGHEDRFYYSPLTDSATYTQGSGAEYPVIDFTAPWYVVSSLASDNGVANSDSVTYAYESGKIHISGKGFLGFMETSVENHLSNSISSSELQYDTSYYHAVNVSNTHNIDSDPVSDTDYFIRIDSADSSDIRIYEIITDSVKVQDYFNNVSQTTTINYNSFGQALEKTVRVGSTATVSESYTYESAGWYFPYLPKTVSKKYSRSGSVAKDSTMYQFNNTGQATSITKYCGTDREVSTKLWDYNTFGIPQRLSKTGKWGQNLDTDSLSVMVDYSSCGRYISSVMGPLNNNVYFDYNESTGLINSQTSVNDLTTEFEHGPFGSIQKQETPDQKQILSRIYWSTGNPDAPSESLYYSWAKASGTNESVTFYDAVGRTLRTVTYGFNNEKLYSDSEYDTKGRLSRASLPYEEGDNPIWSTFAYDNYGRIDEQLAPDSTSTEYTYDDLWQKITISKGSASRCSEVTFNELGETIESKDDMDNIVYTSYYPDGLVKETYTSANSTHKITLSYDAQRNRILIDDPDTGRDTLLFDAFGKLLWQINAKGDTISLEYDKLGRTISSIDSRGEIFFAYDSDTTSKSFGQVDSIYNTNGSLSESFTYDDTYGRLLSSTRRIPDKTFTNEYTYDWYGRLQTRAYPSGFELEYFYNGAGHLEKIKGDGSTIWTCNNVNQLGQITSYTQGNYSTAIDYDAFGMLEEITTGSVFNMTFGFDDIGNLTSREDILTSQKEVFEYDDLSRLTGIDYYHDNTHISSLDMDLTYSDDGNITAKTDVGSTINYGENTAGPHALTSIEDVFSAYEPPPQRITYTGFNKVSVIQDTIAQDTTLTLSFTYGLNNQRVKSVLSRNSTVERIKYFNGDYEEDSTSTGTKKYHYINAPNGLTAIFVIEGSADTLYHVLSDHLGSLNGVINADTDSVTYYSYSAWGIPRDPDDWTSSFEGELFAGRGYTGHEHLDEFNLINMNGRVYDPVLARFLSPDPFVQFPGVADGYNRYAYVMNNPLGFTDPSGYLQSPYGEFKKLENATGGSYHYRGEFFVHDRDRGGFTKYGGFYGNVTGYEGGATGSTSVNQAFYINGILVSGAEYSNSRAYKLPDHVVDKINEQFEYRQGLMASFNGNSSSVGREYGVELGQFKGFDNHFFSYNDETGQYLIPWTDVLIDPIDVLCGNIDWYGMFDQQMNDFVKNSSYVNTTPNDPPFPPDNTIETLLIPILPIFKGIKAAKGIDDLVRAAQQRYPKLAGKIQNHHAIPKYLGGAMDGPMVPLDAAYHQMITNEFRALWKYGQRVPSSAELQRILNQVYNTYPLPPGF